MIIRTSFSGAQLFCPKLALELNAHGFKHCMPVTLEVLTFGSGLLHKGLHGWLDNKYLISDSMQGTGMRDRAFHSRHVALRIRRYTYRAIPLLFASSQLN